MRLIREFILREIAGESILVPTGTTSQEFNGMITMSDTARFIWENLEMVDSFEELVEKMLEEYEIDEETARADAELYISELLRQGFIECTKEDKSW